MHNRFLALCAVFFLAACAPKRIPGTELEDTGETRAILSVMEKYRAALEARDAKAIQALVSPKFRDDGGTPDDPSDDLTAVNLESHLRSLFQKLQNPKVDFNIRRVEFREDDVALAIYYWNASWRMPGLNARPQSDSELEQMVFQKVGGDWKILSGI
ncbi:nuclear transport factor 2 family protein [Corallococcus sp. AB004]|uniref:nuclear transport factor 2 family protein n=1 Tax=Corallococcus TaxID=83461 RepID=UPI000EA36841|nr:MULTISPECIES: nuclear transport factor 2 family protein [Corallococcus]RKI38302.1 nuclear transport factor 2 family protein [Corallococcus sp. AB004]NPC73110.1 nuclear transport factor 2 family protein [Corallococcus exiguus]NPD26650.1 nuclear transport factor 2 family protein [Corallococcus exiguus]NRD47785.1 nuclear transport factor 2 family protein [Corallococcus exiguus]RKI00064.1 nuclear transport factor 2 family protein [Corallococcus sp. AB038B]